MLIALHTAGVGSWDADMRAGWSPGGRTRFPLVLGTDGSGTVVEVGSSVSRFKPGDRVYSYSFDNPKGGFYAEYVAVAAERVAPVPDGLELKPAGAIPTTGLTALQGIDDALHMKSGEILMILGASGGGGNHGGSIRPPPQRTNFGGSFRRGWNETGASPGGPRNC